MDCCCCGMSAFGTKRTFVCAAAMSAFGRRGSAWHRAEPDYTTTARQGDDRAQAQVGRLVYSAASAEMRQVEHSIGRLGCGASLPMFTRIRRVTVGIRIDFWRFGPSETAKLLFELYVNARKPLFCFAFDVGAAEKLRPRYAVLTTNVFLIHMKNFDRGNANACSPLLFTSRIPQYPRGSRSKTSTRIRTLECSKAASKIADTELSAIRAVVRATACECCQGSSSTRMPPGNKLRAMRPTSIPTSSAEPGSGSSHSVWSCSLSHNRRKHCRPVT